MLLLAWLCFVAVSTALPTQQIIGPGATLTALPAPNHILILTPQAQVQLEPSLRYPQPLVQHLSPVARIDSPTDQTVVYYPNENLVNAIPNSGQKQKQLENPNITNIVNQFVSAGQTAQAQLEAFQQQLSQGLEGLIQPVGQKNENVAEMESLKPAMSTDQLVETARQDGRRFYSVSNIPQFYSNFELIHSPISPLFVVPQLQSIRARSVAHPDDKIQISPSKILAENPNLAKIAIPLGEHLEINHKALNSEGNQARSAAENLEVPAALPHLESGEIKSVPIQKESEQLHADSNLGKYLGKVLGKNDASEDIKPELNKKENESIRINEQEKSSELVSFAEALPSGLAISGEGGLSQTKPIGSAIVGKDGVAYSAPSGTAIAGASNDAKSSKSP